MLLLKWERDSSQPGSNTTHRVSSVLVAQWIGRETTNLEIGGSSPSEDDLGSSGLVGYDDCLTRSRSPVRSRVDVFSITDSNLELKGAWSSGMILRSGRRGREFDSPCTPLLLIITLILISLTMSLIISIVHCLHYN